MGVHAADALAHRHPDDLEDARELDLDVLDRDALPAVSYPQRGGLDWAALSKLIAPLLASERLVGMSVADLQPELDHEGTYARRVVELVATHVARV